MGFDFVNYGERRRENCLSFYAVRGRRRSVTPTPEGSIMLSGKQPYFGHNSGVGKGKYRRRRWEIHFWKKSDL